MSLLLKISLVIYAVLVTIYCFQKNSGHKDGFVSFLKCSVPVDSCL